MRIGEIHDLEDLRAPELAETDCLNHSLRSRPRGVALAARSAVCQPSRAEPALSARGSRCLAELTFQVATRTGHTLATVCGGGSGYEQPKAKLCCVESDEVAVAFGPPA